MKPTDILKNEHRIIEIVLQVLEAIANQAKQNSVLDADDANQAIDFFKNFADLCHHGKEEVHLFTKMESKGFPRDGGPTGVMIHEHEQGRIHIQNMSDAIIPASTGNSEALERFVKHAQSYVQLLRVHIEKEDQCLFPMADQALSEEEQQQLLLNFEKTEKEDIGQGVHETYVDKAKYLANKYHIDLGSLGDHVFQCGCSHG